jgi:Tol biopolymer transport system component/tRNA A-37 threonylcarbamoyl transferase component Bud32
MTAPLQRLTLALADRYRIERELGQGGMATVYLAQDLRHDRKVALKVLRPELAAILGGDRFLKEIKTTANLQHPHILSLFDSGEADGMVYYVMPFVQGESLRDRLNREHQLPVEDAVRIAREVADALEYAHGHGVIHRDIKPENILLHGGHAQVADFGIALAVSRSDGGTRMTETGMSLGTPHYMSPEQAMGEREVTAKADIYALGCVLYEMLTAEPPFNGPTAQAIIARVMTEEPRSLTLQRRTIPPHVEAAVVTALSKLPADRFASAALFSAALGNTAFTTTTATRAATAARSPRTKAAAALPWTLLALTAAGLAWALLRPRPSPAPPPVTRFTIAFEGAGRISDGAGSPIAVSPDGSRIAYIGRDSTRATWLYFRVLDREEPAQIAGTSGAIAPFFSPDGATLGFSQDGKIRKVGLGGGAVVTICECNANGISWGADDIIYFSSSNSLHRVSGAGGRPELLLAPDTAKGESLRWPDALPDGSGVLLTLVRQGAPTLGFVSLPDGKLHELGQPGMYPRWVNGGYVAFLQQDGTLFAAPFDAKAARLSGAPVPIVDRVRSGPAFPAKLGIARTGTLAYMGGQTALRELVLADREGHLSVLPAPSRFYDRPKFSPDGERIAMQVLDFATRLTSDIWVADLRAGNLSRITFDSSSSDASWMPDGRRLVYTGRQGTFYRIATDGSGVPESLLARPNRTAAELHVSPDGKFLAFRETDARTRRDVWVAALDTPRTVRPLLHTPFEERSIALSPDGKWLAYISNETGTDELFVRRLEEGSGHWRVSRTGAGEPRWGPGGRELLYRVADTVVSVTMEAGAQPRFSDPRQVLVGRFNSDRNATIWDISPDGRRFIFTRAQGESDTPSISIVLHWFDRLRAAGK